MDQQYQITKKDRRTQLASMVFMLVMFTILMFHTKPEHTVIRVMECAVIISLIVCVGYELYYYFTYNRARKKQFLVIGEDRLIIHNQVVLPEQIDLIVSEGYVHSSIGIKLNHKRWIPQRFQFLFADPHTEQEAFDQLQEWAAKYQIEIREGYVRSLI